MDKNDDSEDIKHSKWKLQDSSLTIFSCVTEEESNFFYIILKIKCLNVGMNSPPDFWQILKEVRHKL